jgi:glycosyltransferase involved in cell wall biosynthesis
VTFNYDVVCFSHLRWDFVYQRPQHLLSRVASQSRVFFVEEPLPTEGSAQLDVIERSRGLTILRPRLPAHLPPLEADAVQAMLLEQFFARTSISEYVLWYYTPMAVGFTRGLPVPLATIYDCMDELSAFDGAPPELILREKELFRRADLVFTGGQSLYEAKRHQHASVYPFASSVDVQHFSRARRRQPDPSDQAHIGRPRLGFFGVLDERFDSELVGAVADLRPDWSVVLIGPVVKIEQSRLPRRPNIHYLGPKPYAELPRYIAAWDVAIIPFARNQATRYISPTKTPEYLAAGCPVVSTPIDDVVRPYGDLGLAHIAEDPAQFIAAAEAALARDRADWCARVDAALASTSWDATWLSMRTLVDMAVSRRLQIAPSSTAEALALLG